MRIISQDKKLDVPYEVTTLRIVSANKEYCVLACTQNMDYEIAFYSTEGKAVKAMEMCRKKYLDFGTYGTNMVPFESPKIFQFPADDEI